MDFWYTWLVDSNNNFHGLWVDARNGKVLSMAAIMQSGMGINSMGPGIMGSGMGMMGPEFMMQHGMMKGPGMMMGHP
jgi:hypothetical protein